MRVIECDICGKEFQTSSNRVKFCRDCRIKYSNSIYKSDKATREANRQIHRIARQMPKSQNQERADIEAAGREMNGDYGKYCAWYYGKYGVYP